MNFPIPEHVLTAVRTDAFVDIRGISKTFAISRSQSVHALADVSFSIARGELLAIVGPSGCGKSTILRIVAGLETASSGLVSVAGSLPSALSEQHELGVAFQEHALLPWLTVEQNIGLPYRLAGLAADQARVRHLAQLVGLSAFLGARPKQLSGGMKQRVAIARSLVLDPEVLLLDEPFGALDLVTRRSLNQELQSLWTNLGTTTLLITHSVEEAVQLADRVIVMAAHPGRVHAEFTIELPRPRSAEVTNSMEFLQLVQAISASLDDASRQSSGTGMK